jgi:hypothetical protein
MATKFTYKNEVGRKWDVGSGTRLTQTKFIFLKIFQLWDECQSAGDEMPVEGFNAYLSCLEFDELPKLKVHCHTLLDLQY